MTVGFEPTLLSRIEDAGINASAPSQQRWVDGWLLRFSPGKAKRARCINAVATGRLSVAEKLALCAPVYEAAGLPLLVRITPFSQPAGLDEALAALGLWRVDDTRVMVKSLGPGAAVDAPAGMGIEAIGHAAFARTVGQLRGSPLVHQQAHAQRLQQAPVPFHAFVMKGENGQVVACGQFACEFELVGLYDVFVAEQHRGIGLGRALCRDLLDRARQLGCRSAYLQVEGDNHAARRVYHRLGFTDAYAYHYRSATASNG